MRSHVPALLAELTEQTQIGVGLFDAEHRFVHVNAVLAAINGVAIDDHIGRSVDEVLPGVADIVNRLLDRVVTEQRALHGIRIVGSIRPGGEQHVFRASYHPLTVGGLRAVGAVVADVTDQERAQRAADRRMAQQRAVARLGQRALETVDPQEIAARVASLLPEALDAATAAVFTTVDRDIDVAAVSGELNADVVSLLRGDALTARAVATGAPQSSPEDVGLHPDLRERGLSSGLAMPVRGASGTLGAIAVYSQRPRCCEPDDVEFLQSVAHVIASVDELARAHRDLSELARVRGRLATEALEASDEARRELSELLHDDVLQRLLFLRQEAESEVAEGRESAAELEAELRHVIAAIRAIVADLHPVALSHAGLAPALRELAERYAERSGLDIQVRISATPPRRHDLLLVNLARELLANIVKHAAASRARLELRELDAVELVVEDDGVGVDPDRLEAAPSEGHIGLAAARERLRVIGGELLVTRVLPRGTRVIVRLPG